MRNFLSTVLVGTSLAMSVGNSPGQDLVKPEVVPANFRCPRAENEAAAKSGVITREQADAIVSELKQIRELLEKQEAQLARALVQRSAAAPALPQRVQMNVGSGWHSIGRADAAVTLVEFADYQCPYCKKFHTEAYPDLKKNYIDTGKVRFVSRDLPLEFHPFALKAAEAARCAADQGKYWEFRETLYLNAAPPNDDVIRKAAETLSLDMQALTACLATEKYKSDVQKDSAEAATLQVTGTPTFVLAKTTKDKLDGVRLVGALPYASFQSAIDVLLKGPSSMAPDDQERRAAQGVQRSGTGHTN